MSSSITSRALGRQTASFTGDPHIPACDGIRGLAIVLVIGGHTALLRVPTSSLQHLGWVGVDLFFVLSGFLITTILLDTKGTPEFFRNFYARRTVRIFPLYYALLIGAFLAAPLFNTPTPNGALWYFLFLANFGEAIGHIKHPASLTVLWSLAIEEQFYWVWPLIVAHSRQRGLLWSLVAVAVLEPLLRWTCLMLGVPREAVYIVTPTRLDGLAIGALTATMMIQEREWLARLALPALLGGAFVFFCARTFDEANSVSGRDYYGPAVQVAGLSGLAIAFGGLLARALTAPPTSVCRRFFENPALGFLGRLSYAMYLVHLPLVVHTRTFIKPLVLRSSPIQRELIQCAFTLTMLVAATGLAFVSFHAYEKHFLKLKRHFPYQRTGVSRDPNLRAV